MIRQIYWTIVIICIFVGPAAYAYYASFKEIRKSILDEVLCDEGELQSGVFWYRHRLYSEKNYLEKRKIYIKALSRKGNTEKKLKARIRICQFAINISTKRAAIIWYLDEQAAREVLLEYCASEKGVTALADIEKRWTSSEVTIWATKKRQKMQFLL